MEPRSSNGASSNRAPVAAVDLYWLPLGAGARCVRWNGRMYEAVLAAFQRRARCPLYHAALEVHLDGVRHVIEMAPVWDRPEPDRGVVAEGPVGLSWLARSKWFRYEIRCWPDGTIPDRWAAVGGPRRLSDEARLARTVLDLVAAAPVRVWGRDQAGDGEMWNSNSLIAWLLATAGYDLTAIAPPPGGRAPGWSAGSATAERQATRGRPDTRPPATTRQPATTRPPATTRSPATINARDGGSP